MNHQVPEFYRHVSERISNILDDIGYSQEDRDRKVRHATANELLESIPWTKKILTYFLFGSRAEGSTGPGLHSDFDIVYAYNCIKMILDLSGFQPGHYNLLMVQDEWTHPGYVKLQGLSILPDNTPVPDFNCHQHHNIVDSYDRIVLSNRIVRADGPNRTLAGPALHQSEKIKELSRDFVFAIRCTQWPNEAHEWFQRRRLHGWPKGHHVRNGMQDGCFVTAVGHPHSHESDLEWRLSFSVTERMLTRSFEDTVMKVYILLKMIKKTYIEPILGDAFSSYHCKVCMLWMREKTPAELWRTENLLYCLSLCLEQLYEWATMGYCPDYFIVTNNIYDRKIYGETRIVLIKVLGALVSENCRFLLGLECCNLGDLLFSDCSNFDVIHCTINIHNLFSEAIADYSYCASKAITCRYRMLRDIPQEYTTLISHIRITLHVLQRAPDTVRICLHYVLMTLLSRLGFHVISVCKENAHYLSQEEVDYLIGLASRCLSLGINSDATSVRLKLCGLGTMLGDYDLTEICLQHIRDQNIRCIFSGTLLRVYTLGSNYASCVEKLLTERYSIKELLQNHLSYSVVYLPSEISIAPIALRMEMFRSIGTTQAVSKDEHWYDWAVIDSCMCLYFFQYLNFVKLGKQRFQQVAINNLIHVIRSEPKIPHRDTGLNLVGYSFMREDQLINAFICFCISLKSHPHNNAAKFFLGILFRKANYARRRVNKSEKI